MVSRQGVHSVLEHHLVGISEDLKNLTHDNLAHLVVCHELIPYVFFVIVPQIVFVELSALLEGLLSLLGSSLARRLCHKVKQLNAVHWIKLLTIWRFLDHIEFCFLEIILEARCASLFVLLIVVIPNVFHKQRDTDDSSSCGNTQEYGLVLVLGHFVVFFLEVFARAET